VKATFFVLGHKAQKNPAIIKRIKAEGHTLGNHTFTHIDGTVIDPKKIQTEINSTHRLIQNICGVKVTLFRPPFGFFNWRVFAAAKKQGYQIVLWTFDLSDWSIHSADQYVKTVAENLTNGAIILMHDGGPKREALIEALPQIIKLIKKRGYRIENLTSN
jgi:peptidoglycan/xylan/chitin deacetylase (PgdA/CDA1 family)